MTQQHSESRMRNKSSRREQARVSKLRWAGYAVAGAATAFSGNTAAEADIHYFPNVNKLVQDDNYFDNDPDSESIALAGSARILFKHRHFGEGAGAAFATASNGTFNSIAKTFSSGGYGSGSGSSSDSFVANLPYGLFISGLSSFFSKGVPGTMAFAFYDGPFNGNGEGFLSFHFDVGNGTQYGWARVNTLNSEGVSFNDFVVVDYAYADPGVSLRVGQIPEPGSLGLLATGAAGLLTWRRKRKAA
ncbi:MAG: PEP-CTERM sorting domain-containing protein [Pirellulaceae bacterium]